jgi:pimeloyl-ACP methyl ester carboxylesterase
MQTKENPLPRWVEGDILANGTQLHYYRTGGNKPGLVLAHGITDDGLCWTPVAEALSAEYDVVMVDLRAHGKSQAPDQGYSYKIMATELAGLISGLGLEKPALLGHSMGAVTVLVLASLFPEMPRAVILEDPPNRWDEREETLETLEQLEDMIARMRATKDKTRDELLVEIRKEHPDWSESEIHPWADAKLRFDLKIIDLIHRENDLPVNNPGILRRITCQALLITADPAQGAALDEQDVKSLKALVPHLVHEHIPGAGHSIRREQFTRYLGVVANFLSNTL